MNSRYKFPNILTHILHRKKLFDTVYISLDYYNCDKTNISHI